MIKAIKGKIEKEHLRNILIKEKGCRFSRKSSIDFCGCHFEGKCTVHDNVILYNCDVGYATYISEGTKFFNTSIGRYCSIGPNVHIISGRHPTRKFVSTSPAFFSTAEQAGFTYVKINKFNEHAYSDFKKKQYISIGNDVWIGDGARIMERVRVADGTIVAAGAIVVKDTEPFSIVGGVPAKILRYRFSPEDINYLMNLKWWNKDLDWIEKYADYFEDIEKLKIVLHEDVENK